ncbi:MAG: amine oxidase [Dictyoglomus sp. NZ13-RE01]|nr:MAG: amine oxidase [Dictyoglomus sp. NZ13-RE01]
MKWDIIVVGGGVAGLTASIKAASYGKKVLLFEKNDKCGGLLNTFEKDGFLFDGGTKSLEGIVLALLKDFELKLDYTKTVVSLGIEDKLIEIKNEDDLELYKNLLLTFYKESSKDVEKIIKSIEEIGNLLKATNKILGFKKNLNYIFTQFIPGFFSLLFNLKVLNKMKKPVERYISEDLKIENRYLSNVLIQHFFKGTPAFFVFGYFYYYMDYIYPKGGTASLAVSLEKKARDLGVEIKTNTPVEKVIPYENVVVDSQGNKYHFDTLIWAADLKKLYLNLDLNGLDDKTKAKVLQEKENILNGKTAESVFNIFIEVDEQPEVFSKIHSPHVFYTPSRKGIMDLKGKEQFIINNFEKLSKNEIFKILDEFCSNNTYEISIPALKDPEAAPSNKTGIIVSFLFNYEITKKAKEFGFYEELKDHVSRKVIDILSETIYKDVQFKDKIIKFFSATPLTIENISGSSCGSIVGWSMEYPLPVNGSLINMVGAVKTSINNIFKAGQWTMSPAGIPTSIITGQLASNEALKYLKKGKK